MATREAEAEDDKILAAAEAQAQPVPLDSPEPEPHHTGRERHAIALILEPSKLPAEWDDKTKAKKPWLPDALLAPETLNLFYDLVAVAVLENFSQGDPILNAKQILSFFSFFILFWFVWATQALYDLRFQANDVVHRLMKFLQIMTFGYIGAACQNWWPSWIRKPGPFEYSQEALWRLQAHQTIVVVTIALGVARLVLASQYLYVYWLAKRADRPRRTLLIEAAASAASCLFCVASAWVSPTTSLLARVKLALLYCGTAVELFAYIGVSLSPYYIRLPSERVGDRINALTLIILGEGFISFLQAANTRMAAVGARDPWIFVEIFFAVALLAFLYHFAMAVFDNSREMGRKRTLLYVLLHFPLHFCLLLLISALENLLTALSFYSSADDLASLFTNVTHLENQMTDGHLSQQNYYALMSTYDLSLSQPFPQFVEWLAASNESDSNNFVALVQYFTEIAWALALQTYGLTMENSTTAVYNALQNLPTTITNETEKQQTVRLAAEDFYRVYDDISSSIFGGVLWLFPTVGGVLVLISLVSIVRHPKQSKTGLTIDLVNLSVGVIVALLGLLDIGSKNFAAFATWDTPQMAHQAPIFNVVTSEFSLVIPAAICFGLIVFQLILLIGKGHLRRRRATRQKALAALDSTESIKSA